MWQAFLQCGLEDLAFGQPAHVKNTKARKALWFAYGGLKFQPCSALNQFAGAYISFIQSKALTAKN
jgi:hypothetical protein